jgi:CheY-like chemotaxis protein
LKFIPKNIVLSDLLDELKLIYNDILIKQGKHEDIKIKIYIPENERQLQIKVDPKRLKQVFSNLINNAIKFTEIGTIEFGYKLSENKNMLFFVKDTGLGIPYNMQKRIFEQFIQVEDVIERNSSGTGLGLTISRNIVQLQGGNLWLTSSPGKGSNFFFYLPYRKPVDVAEKEKSLENQRGKSVKSGLSDYVMIIAEDDDTNYFFLKESLKKTKIKTIRAKTGLEAINLVENTDKIDIILMDIKMPEVSGLEATRYIKHIRPDIPIVAQTAFAMDNDKQSCLEAGCSDYISKPLKTSILLDVIYKNIKKSKQETFNQHA